jgi:hypothetical protein
MRRYIRVELADHVNQDSSPRKFREGSIASIGSLGCRTI